MTTPSFSDAHLTRLASALAERYRLERELGQGGMATVWLAHDLRHEREVAIKVLHPELSAVLGPERFLAEIKTTANLQHPHILPLFDSGSADGLLYYVMPCVEGETLRARLERERQLPVDDAVRIASEVADALHYAHERGVVHRDIKPENILLQNGHALVADFGIALAVEQAGGQRMTQTGLSLGTPQYMAPEQAMGERTIDARADIYALGAVTYEMLAGEPPFAGPNAQAIVAQVITAEAPSLIARRRSVPPHVAAAAHTALEKLPADRFATAREFADVLAGRVLAPSSASAWSSAHPSPSAWTARAWRDAFRLPVTRLLAAALAVVLLGGALHEWPRGTAAGTDEPRTPVRFRLSFDNHVTWVNGFGSPAALSPDGARLVFRGRDAAGVARLYVRPLSDLAARALPGTENAEQPFWSPDGRWIGFSSGGQIEKIQVDGGTPMVLTDAQHMEGASWGTGDRIVFGGTRLRVITPGGAAPRLLTPSDTGAQVVERWPLVLPDGKTVLYSRWYNTMVSSARIAVVSLPEGTPTVLDVAGTQPLAVLDGQLVYATASGVIMAVPFDLRSRRTTGTPVPVIDDVTVGPGGSMMGSVSPSGSVVYVSGSATATHLMSGTPGALPKLLLPDEGPYAFPRVSPDGRHIAFALVAERSDVWIYDLPSGPLRRLTFEGVLNDRPEWTPDSRQVLFRSNRSGTNAIWIKPADGSGAPELLYAAPPRAVDEAVLTSDGEYLVVQLDSAGSGGKISYRRMHGDTALHVIARTGLGQAAQARPSPDGHWVAYGSSEAGNWDVYVKPFPALDTRYQVSLSGGSQPVWSPDGHRLFYNSGGRLLAATLAFDPFTIVRRDTLMENVSEMLAGEGQFTFYHANYDVMPDGKSFVFLTAAETDAQVIMVYDWKLELKARTAAQTAVTR